MITVEFSITIEYQRPSPLVLSLFPAKPAAQFD